MMGRPRGFAPWSPKAAGVELVLAVEDVLDEYRSYLPMTIRQIFYRLVIKSRVEKTERGYKRLCEHLNRARRAEMIPMDAIRDDGTTVELGYVYEDRDDLAYSLKYYARKARMDLQGDQPERLELWCEAAGMVPQLAKVAKPYGITVVSSGGFDSVTGKYRMAERYVDYANDTLTVLHLGDYDPSGVHIFSSLSEDVSAFVDYLGGTVNFERLLVLPRHIEEFSLPTAPPKPTDKRAFDGNRTVQAEAFDPATLAAFVEDAIVARTNLSVLEDARAYQASVREDMASKVST